MQEAAQKITAVLANSFNGDAHTLLMAIYRDESRPIELRLDAAKAAIGYERPRLAVTEHSGNLSITHEEALKELSNAANANLIELQATPIEAAVTASGEPSKARQ